MAKYSNINSVKDIEVINKIIRRKVKAARSRHELTKLYRESEYLVTLTYSTSFHKAYSPHLLAYRRAAEREFSKTAKLIDSRNDYGPKYKTSYGGR